MHRASLKTYLDFTGSLKIDAYDNQSLTSIKWNLTWILHLVSIMQIKERRTWNWERAKEEKKGSNHAFIILKILWKRRHRGNTIRTVSAVWKSAETIEGGTQLESRYLGRALSNGTYYDQLSFSVSASWSLSVESHCSPHASNHGIQPCYGPGTMGLNEHGWMLQKQGAKINIYFSQKNSLYQVYCWQYQV